MRAVIDTNVLLSGLFWHGTPRGLIERVREGTVTLVSSPALLEELARIINGPKFRPILVRTSTDPVRLLAEIQYLAELTDPPPLPAPVSRDPDDDAVLTLATAIHADIIVTGDGDLLILGSFAGIPIVTPTQALAAVNTMKASIK